MGTNGTTRATTRAKTVTEMTVEELRSEIYRLKRKNAELQHSLNAKSAILEHMEGAFIKRVSEAVDRVLDDWRHGRR